MEDANEKRLFDILNNRVFTFEFISGIAGDRLLTVSENETLGKLLKEAGDDFYVKLLFYITHQIFSEKDSKLLWDEILGHKQRISTALGRNVEITVATLDYLTNIKSEIKKPKLIGEAFISKIAQISSVDPLTKLYNRQYLFSKLNEELIRYRRYDMTFSIVMMDIDDFKKVNDSFGHQKGDEILNQIGTLMETSKRELDICARYGGEEFMMLLPHTSSKEAHPIAERLRATVEDFFKSGCKLTISIGVSNCPENSTILSDLIQKADQNLYKSKRMGKNRVTCE